MHRKGFSLASILLLTAVVAVFLAAMCTIWLQRGSVKPEPALLGALGGLVVGLCVGVGIGANHVRPIPGLLLAPFVGMIAGAASGVLLVVPNKLLPIAAGSLLIVLFGALVRYCSRRPPKQ